MTDDTPQIHPAALVPFAGPPLMRPLFTGAPHLGSLPEVMPEVTPQLAQASDRAMEAIADVARLPPHMLYSQRLFTGNFSDAPPSPSDAEDAAALALHSSQMTPAIDAFAEVARDVFAGLRTEPVADEYDGDDSDDDENDERDNQPTDLPAPAAASPLLNGELTIAEIRANVGDNVPAVDAEVERVLHFAVRVENIKDHVRRDSPAGAGDLSAEYRGAANTFNAERNILPRALSTTNYPTSGQFQELHLALGRLAEALTRVAAALPSSTATDRRTGIIENFNQLLMLLRAGMFRLVRLHRAGDDTSWVQGTLLNETRSLMVAQLAATDHIVVHTGPIQTPMYRGQSDVINFTDGFDLLLPTTSSQPGGLRVFALNPLRSARGGFIHPNVSGTGLCFGDGQAAALNALRRGDLLSFFTVVKTILSSFSGSPHHDASDWDRGRVECAECHQRIVTDGVGDAAGINSNGYNYHLGCTALVDGPHGEERLPLGSTLTSAFSNRRFHPNSVRRIVVRGSAQTIGSTEQAYLDEVQRRADAGSYVCPRCETVHPPGAADVIVDVRRGLSGMMGCPVCIRVDGTDRYTDPRTNTLFGFTVTPPIRRLIRPAAVVVPVVCPSCAAVTLPSQIQVVRHATTGDEVKTCAHCDPYKLGIQCVEANLPEINAVTSRLVRAFADNVLIQHITISQPANVAQASGLAQVVSRLWLATDISRLFTEPAITFASKLGVWQVFMSSHNESFSSFPLFTATPEQIAQHDYNATALFNATYGSNTPNPSNGTLWVGYDPGATDVPADVAADAVRDGDVGGQAVGTFGGSAPEVQPTVSTPEPDVLTQLRTGAHVPGDLAIAHLRHSGVYRDIVRGSDNTFGAPVAPVAPEHFGG